MRALVFACLAIFLVMTINQATAQKSPLDKDSKILAGGVSFAYYSGELYDGYKSSLVLDPTLLAFTSSKFAFGASLLIGSNIDEDVRSRTFGIGPQCRIFFDQNETPDKVKGDSYPYLGAGMFFTKTTYSVDYYDWDANTFSFVINFGLIHMLSDAVGVFGQISYYLESLENGSGNDYSLSGNVLNINLGFGYFLY